MGEAGMFGFYVFQPPGRPELTVSVQAPQGWQQVPVPDERPDFADPTAYLPLGVVMAPYGAVLLSLAARPAFDGGTVAQWLERHCRLEGMEPTDLRSRRIGELDAVTAETIQQTDAGPMRMRLVMIEDGRTLLVMAAVAPEAIWPSLDATFDRMISSYRPVNRRGQTVPLGVEAPEEADVPRPDAQRAAGPAFDVMGIETEEEPEQAVASEPVGGAEAVEDGSDEAAPEPAGESAGAPEEGAGEYVSPPDRPAHHAELALADDAASLDVDDPFNQYFQNNGIGLVPRVLEVDRAGKCAKLGCGAIAATMVVPFGWHVIDDGRRTLVFDRANQIQVNLNLFQPQGIGQQVILESLLNHYRRQQPQLEHIFLELGGMRALAMRNLKEGDDAIERAYLLRSIPGEPSLLLQVRVTALPSEMVRAMDLAEVLIDSLRFAAEENQRAAHAEIERLRNDPRGRDTDYIAHAEQLERDDRLAEMEELVQVAGYNQGHPWPAVLASIYEKRLHRMIRDGRQEDARHARERAIDAIRQYAAGATSGGEGAALSREADQFIARLPAV